MTALSWPLSLMSTLKSTGTSSGREWLNNSHCAIGNYLAIPSGIIPLGIAVLSFPSGNSCVVIPFWEWFLNSHIGNDKLIPIVIPLSGIVVMYFPSGNGCVVNPLLGLVAL